MKTQRKPFVSRIRSLACVLCAVSLFGTAVQSSAALYALNHKNSGVTIDSTSGAGVFDWQVDGVNQLAQSWLYYRVGLAPETGIQTIGVPVVNQYVNNAFFRVLDLTYANPNFSVRTVYSLTGGDPGSASANLSETLTVANLSGASLDFHFFQYSDFDLNNSALDQSVQFIQNMVNLQYYKVVQTDGSSSVVETINTANPPIGHFEAGLFPATLNKLTDGVADNLTDALNAGNGDLTFAYQWDVVLAPGASFQISKLISVVPEPSVSALVLSGLAVLGLLLRRRRTAA